MSTKRQDFIYHRLKNGTTIKVKKIDSPFTSRQKYIDDPDAIAFEQAGAQECLLTVSSDQ